MSLFILADTFFIANGVGSDGIAALNIVLPVINIIHGIGWMFGVGGAALFSIALGKGEVFKAKQYFSRTILLVVIISFIFACLALLFSQPLIYLLGARGQIIDMSLAYYQIVVGCSPFFIMNNVMISFLRNDNSPQLATKALLTGGLFNIIMDYLLIFPLGMGLSGAAIATGVSPIIGLLVSSFHWRNPKRIISFEKVSLEFNQLKVIVKIGFSSFLNEFSSAFVMFLFNIVLLHLAGNIGVAAYGIIANMNIIVIAIFTGLGQGLQPLASVAYGRGDRKNLKKTLRHGLCLALVFALLFLVVIFAWAPEITDLFNAENNVQLAKIANQGLRLYFLSYPFTAINFVVIFFMSAIEKAKASFVPSTLRGVILIPPFLWLLTYLFELQGVWLTMLGVDFASFLVSIYVIYTFESELNVP